VPASQVLIKVPEIRPQILQIGLLVKKGYPLKN
jgi:hypothetical protein